MRSIFLACRTQGTNITSRTMTRLGGIEDFDPQTSRSFSRQAPTTRSVARAHAAPTVRPRCGPGGRRLTARSCGSRRPLAHPPGRRTACHTLTGDGVRVPHVLAASARAPPPPRGHGGSARAHRVNIALTPLSAVFGRPSRRRGNAARDRPTGLLLPEAGEPLLSSTARSTGCGAARERPVWSVSC